MNIPPQSFIEGCFTTVRMPLIRVVFFDLWNTLLHNQNYSEYRLPALNKYLHKHGVILSEEDLLQAYQAGFQYSSQVIASENHRHVETSEIVDKVLESVGLVDPPDKAELVRMYEEACMLDPPRLKDGVVETLEAVQGKYRIGMISVTGVSPGRIIRTFLKEHRIYHYFDGFIFSDEVGYVKPSPVLFQTALKLFKVEPHETVHVGDSLKGDIAGAKQLGMKTVWIKRRNQGFTDENSPDFTIDRLPELLDILEKLES